MVARSKINYVKHGDHTTNMPSTIQYMNGSGGIMYTVSKTLKYAYDNMGNISAIYDNGKLKCRYEYDTLNRLTREDNKLFGKTWTYFYDDNGNIIEKRTYSYTLCDTKDLEEKSYTYDENLYSVVGDRVERVNGYFVTYDDIGRVSQYKYMDCTWNKGKLIGLGSNTFTYDYKGRRTSKNGITFTYDSQGRLVEQSNGIKFIYDDTGVAGISYNGTLYTYEKDVFGNVISILDRDGRRMVQYMYDAWGNHKIVDGYGNTITSSTHIGIINPIRYRSYYYDTETGLYYLQSRYYDPVIGRFISPDDVDYIDPESINGLNLYAYCGNNPVMNVDPSGHALDAIIDMGSFIWSASDFINDPTWENFGWMLLDLLFLFVPFLSGSGGLKAVTKMDDIYDLTRISSSVDDIFVIGQSMNSRVIPRALSIGADWYGGLSHYNDIAKFSKKIAHISGYLHNMGFIAGKAFRGAKFIDIGFDATRVLKTIKGAGKKALELFSRFTIYSERFFAIAFRKKNIARVIWRLTKK